MVAISRVTEQAYDFSIATAGGRRGQTWGSSECAEFFVEAYIEDGQSEFEAGCRST
jgi:hypothetical protein